MPDRAGDRAFREDAGCALIEQRLEEVAGATIDDGDRTGSFLSRRAACTPANPAPMITTCGLDAMLQAPVLEVAAVREVTAYVAAPNAPVTAKTDGHAPIFLASGCESPNAAR